MWNCMNLCNGFILLIFTDAAPTTQQMKTDGQIFMEFHT